MPATPAVRAAMTRGALIGIVAVFVVAFAVMLALGVDTAPAFFGALLGGIVIGGGLGMLFASRMAAERG